MSTRSIRAALLAGLALLIAAQGAVAGSPPIVRTGQSGAELALHDLSARDGTVLAGWEEHGIVGAEGGFASSETSGNAFVEWQALEGYSTARLDACPAPLYRIGVLGYDGPGGFRAMQLANGIDGRLIAQAGTDYLRPDITCLDAKLIVMAVLVKTSGSTRLTVWTFKPNLTDGAAFGFDLGPANKGSGPVVVASGGWVHVAWMSGSSLRYKRFKVGAGPGYALTPKPTVTIESTSGQSAPQLGVDGKRVVLAWQRKASVVARVSKDRGVSFGARRVLFAGDAGSAKVAFLTSADARGTATIVAATVSSEGITFKGHVMASTNGGQTWTKVAGTSHTQGFVAAALDGTAAAPLLHLAWDQRASGLDPQSIQAGHGPLP